ncbi:SUF system Fe-S cluster assembly protein [Acetobacter sp. LMG 32666]|uniref:SUF system Fe-S cluster assembly protein n=1 Tax=Acetobacter sp. LMG 32666 TaxID=2959295 RepID=UPI0030C8208F
MSMVEEGVQAQTHAVTPPRGDTPVEAVLHAEHTQDESATAKVEGWTPDGDDTVQNATPEVAGKVAGPASEDAVIEAIATVHDPEIPVNIYELGLIYAIDLYDDGRVRIEMTLTAPNCPSAQELPIQVKDAVEKVPGVQSAEVDVVWDPPWDMSRMSDEARLALNMF